MRANTWYVNLPAFGRLGLAVAGGAIVWASLPSDVGTGVQFLASWDVAGAAYLALAWSTISTSDASFTRRHARTQDVGAFFIFFAVLVAAFASIAAISILLEGVKDLPLRSKTLHLALSFVALFASWLLIHTLYAFHYARRYYASGEDPQTDSRGVRFPGRENPDYFDFAYYSFVVGMTSQVSDVDVTAHHMRRLTLMHSILSFIFNIAILALSVNIFVSVI